MSAKCNVDVMSASGDKCDELISVKKFLMASFFLYH